MPPSARREALGDVPEEVRASDHRCHGTSAAHSGFLLSLVIAPAFVPLIGCGQGELAGAVARRGYEIVKTALEALQVQVPKAPEGGEGGNKEEAETAEVPKAPKSGVSR